MTIKMHFLCLKDKIMFDSEKEAGCKDVGKKLPVFLKCNFGVWCLNCIWEREGGF